MGDTIQDHLKPAAKKKLRALCGQSLQSYNREEEGLEIRRVRSEEIESMPPLCFPCNRGLAGCPEKKTVDDSWEATSRPNEILPVSIFWSFYISLGKLPPPPPPTICLWTCLVSCQLICHTSLQRAKGGGRRGRLPLWFTSACAKCDRWIQIRI